MKDKIIIGSAKIAEFLGSKYINDAPDDYPDGYYYQPEDLDDECPTGDPNEWCFSISWDWLIPVYRKILDIINDRSKYDKDMISTYERLKLDIQMSICNVDIEKAFDSIVKFINCWNSNQNDK